MEYKDEIKAQNIETPIKIQENDENNKIKIENLQKFISSSEKFKMKKNIIIKIINQLINNRINLIQDNSDDNLDLLQIIDFLNKLDNSFSSFSFNEINTNGININNENTQVNNPEEFYSKHLSIYKDQRDDGFLPLSIRLVNFLESTTDDLRDAVDQLFKVASMDELTQIYNRRALNHFMKNFIEKLSGYNGIAVIMVDVDHFKHVNDTYGHDVGDMVLREGVGQVKYLFNQADVIGRWGGEEFVGIKPNMTKEEALDFSEMLRRGVSEMELDVLGHITVSVGVTMVQEGDTEESIFKRIDDALYEAKETGRNKVVFR